MTGIYQIYNMVNGNCYIGSAVNINKRFKDHKFALRGNYHCNTHLQRAWDKYGEDAFLFSVIYQCEKDFLIDYEQRAIDFHKERSILYNINPTAGSNLGSKFSDEARRKISESQKGKVIPEEMKKRISEKLKGNIPWNKGKKTNLVPWNKGKKTNVIPWNKGMQMSDEHRKKLSEVHKGHYPSDESRKKRSETIRKLIQEKGPLNAGWHHTEEAKLKISKGAKGRIKSPEECKRISDVHKGMKHTEETKQKIREIKRLYYLEKKKTA